MSLPRALAYIFRPDIEGGLVDDPNDPGGLTNLGLSQRAYPNLNIRGITPATAAPIYERDYWDRIQGAELPDAVSFALFDFAVNSGVSAAVHALQRALHITEDGVMGPVTVKATTLANPKELIARLSAERVILLASLPQWVRYRKDWAWRVTRTAMEALDG